MRIITFLFTLFLAFQINAAAVPPEIGSYVNTLVDQVSSMLADKSLSENDKVSKSKELLSKNLNFDWMADYSLGRSKKDLTPEQAVKYESVYSQYMIKTYASLVKKYNGEKTKVIKSYEMSPNEYMVITEVAKPGNPPVKVSYLVHKGKEGIRISDIITEGVSLINSQQEEFRNIINNKGFDVLVNKLKPSSAK